MLGLKNDNDKKSKGMTYAEVAACLFVVSIVIAPICASLVSSSQTRAEAETMREGTQAAEALMEDIKEQLTKDISDKNRLDSNKITNATLRSQIETKTQYLSTVASDTTRIKLNDFFTHPETRYPSQYATDRYAYEAALWNIESAPLLAEGTGYVLNLDSNTLQNAVKLFSSNEPGLHFDAYPSSGSLTASGDLIKFEIGNEMLKGFKGELFLDDFIPKTPLSPASSGYKITDVCTITLSKTGSNILDLSPPISQKGVINIDEQKVSANGWESVIYTITRTTPLGSGTQEGGVVLLDLRKIIRDFDPHVSIKFVNKINENYPITIKVLRNTISGETIDDIDKKIGKQLPIVIDSSSTGQTVIERITDIEDIKQNNYIMVMIIRDKNPRVGQPGKIIKKMIDIYSYSLPE